jgi:hypothetical protein
VPALLAALFIYNKAEIVLDSATKSAVRLCSKHLKILSTLPSLRLGYTLML